MKISEVQIIPIKPINGLVSFASVVLDSYLYLGGIGIYTRPEGGYRLTYPTRKVGTMSHAIYHPIDRVFAEELSKIVISKYEEVIKTYDRHNNTATT